jgi:DNA-binding MarR family transcriptional regulator
MEQNQSVNSTTRIAPDGNGHDSVEQAKLIVRRLTDIAHNVFTVADNPAADLPLAQLRVCGSLRAGPRPMSALSRELGVSLSAMTQIADRLERSHLAKRVAQGQDRRIRYLHLTARGRKVMRVGEDVRVQSMAAVLANMSDEDKREVVAGLDRLLGAAKAMKNENGSDTYNLDVQNNNVAQSTIGRPA